MQLPNPKEPPAKPRLVIIESPYAGDVERNTEYARRAMAHSLSEGEAPFLSHLLYTQVLNDEIPGERSTGIYAGLSWGAVAEQTIVYDDYGISEGMKIGICLASVEKRPIKFRSIGKNPGDEE